MNADNEIECQPATLFSLKLILFWMKVGNNVRLLILLTVCLTGSVPMSSI